jgi:hypothetical protein
MKACVVRIALSSAGLLLTTAWAGAGVIYQTGFEAPTFAAGPIGGQDGWVDKGTGNAVVQSSVAASGTQALLMRNTDARDFADQFFSASAAEKVFTFETDYLHSGSNNSDTQSTLGAFGNNGKFVANVGYQNGRLYFGNTNSALYAPATATNDVWHHLVLTVDLAGYTISATADGQSLGTLPINTLLPTTELTLIGIATTGGTNTVHYYDNVVISSAVPEPGSLALLAPAALALLRYRRD